MRARRTVRIAVAATLGAVALALLPALTLRAAAQDYAAIIAAPDRSEADRETDKRRDPVKLLAFTGARTGMKVLDMGAGGGYSTELMARAAGPTGTVYGQDAPDLADRAKERFDQRAQGPAMKNVVRVLRPYDDPVPPEVRDLDLITFFFAYHDTCNIPIDRAAMNRKMFAALKPGGVLVVADHSARQGDGVSVTKTLHRIEESTLKSEIAAAGFKLVAESDFLRHPEDPRDEIVFRPKVPVDEFVLKFQKPQ